MDDKKLDSYSWNTFKNWLMSIRYTFMFIYLNFLRVWNLQNTIVKRYVE